MKHRDVILVATLIGFACFMQSSLALDVNVYGLCERNMSLDLDPNIQIVPDENDEQSSGIFAQDFTIARAIPKGCAVLQIMDVYDDDMLLFGPEFITEVWTMSVGLAMTDFTEYEYNDLVVDSWSTIDSSGNNVTVTTIATNNTLMNAMGSKADVANWNLGGNTYAGLISFFDRNTTKQIIGTLTIN